MAITAAALARVDFGVGNHRDWLSRACVDAVSGFATGGGIFRSRVGIRMAHCDLLVPGSGMARDISERAVRRTVRCHPAALAGAALRSQNADGWIIIDCAGGFWFLTPPY